MKRILLVLVLLVAGGAVVARNAEAWLLFHFDPARVSPEAAGESRLREVELDGLVLWVADPRPGMATVFYLHGNAGNLADRAARFTRFLDRGLGLVAVGYPGSSGSAGAQSPEAVQAAADTAYAGLGALVGDGPVVIYGESLGTGVALATAQGAARMPDGIVLEAPYTGILDVAGRMYPSMASLLERLDEPWPSRQIIATLDVPMLLLHGTQDDLIPPDMSETLLAAAPGDDKRLFKVQGAGHTNVWQPGARDVLFAFLSRF